MSNPSPFATYCCAVKQFPSFSHYKHYGVRLVRLGAHKERKAKRTTKILSSVVSYEKEFLACLILKIVVSDKNR